MVTEFIGENLPLLNQYIVDWHIWKEYIQILCAATEWCIYGIIQRSLWLLYEYASSADRSFFIQDPSYDTSRHFIL